MIHPVFQCKIVATIPYRPEFEVPEVGGGEAGELELGDGLTGLPVLVVAVRGGAADELPRRVGPGVNPLTRVPIEAGMDRRN